jgi:REP element-mobilizing transposase RayT
MKSDSFRIEPRQRACIESAFGEAAGFRGWAILALSIRTQHIHMVLAGADPPEKMMTTLKAYATRRMRAEGLLTAGAVVWARHGSTRPVTGGEGGLAAVIDYVANRQGEPLPGSGPLHQPGRGEHGAGRVGGGS